eukprot:4752336-Pyramimonas_sp.AAC.1
MHRPVAGPGPPQKRATGLCTACRQACGRPVHRLYTGLSRCADPSETRHRPVHSLSTSLPQAYRQAMHRPVVGPGLPQRPATGLCIACAQA